jgi:predicted alpha/beta hydrolase
MGRSASTTRHDIDQQTALQNQINQQLLGERQSLSGILLPQYRQLLNQGYTPQEQAAITGQSQGAINSAYDALRQNAANRLAQTNNSAGFGELLDDLGRGQAQQSASTAQQNQIQFAQQQQQNMLRGLQGIASLYGVDTGLLASGLGNVGQLLSTRAGISSNGNALLGPITGLGLATLGIF